jgi:hypothetical protein
MEEDANSIIAIGQIFFIIQVQYGLNRSKLNLFAVKYLSICEGNKKHIVNGFNSSMLSNMVSVYQWGGSHGNSADPLFDVQIIEDSMILRPSFVISSFQNLSIGSIIDAHYKKKIRDHRFYHVDRHFFDREGWDNIISSYENDVTPRSIKLSNKLNDSNEADPLESNLNSSSDTSSSGSSIESIDNESELDLEYVNGWLSD